MAIEVEIKHVSQLAEMRRMIGEFTESAGVVARDVVLAASELATNSLLYVGGTCRLVASYPVRGTVRVVVSDDGGSPFEMPAKAPLPEAVRGRGLRIVDALTSRWGISTGLGHTHVWFELDFGT